jgi:hypothetical protein
VSLYPTISTVVRHIRDIESQEEDCRKMPARSDVIDDGPEYSYHQCEYFEDDWEAASVAPALLSTSSIVRAQLDIWNDIQNRRP